MAKEIERKFLVVSDDWRAGAVGTHFRQGYILAAQQKSVRVRLAGNKAKLTIKSAQDGATRDEYEYAIPTADANALLDTLCELPIIEKTRYEVVVGGLTWEVDEFEGANAGLIVAEIELTSEDQQFEIPGWVGEEVTQNPRYLNANLVKSPYTEWTG